LLHSSKSFLFAARRRHSEQIVIVTVLTNKTIQSKTVLLLVLWIVARKTYMFGFSRHMLVSFLHTGTVYFHTQINDDNDEDTMLSIQTCTYRTRWCRTAAVRSSLAPRSPCQFIAILSIISSGLLYRVVCWPFCLCSRMFFSQTAPNDSLSVRTFSLLLFCLFCCKIINNSN